MTTAGINQISAKNALMSATSTSLNTMMVQDPFEVSTSAVDQLVYLELENLVEELNEKKI